MPLPPPAWAIGIGNSPPARKLASLPLSATRFGSARLWNRPRVDSALMSTPRSYFSLRMNRFRKSLNVYLPLAVATCAPNLNGSAPVLVAFSSSYPGAENCCVVTRPRVLLMPVGLVNSEMPSSVSADRLTSANRTFSSTWLVGARLHLQQVDDFFLLLDEARRQAGDLLARPLCWAPCRRARRHGRCSRPGSFSPGNSCLTCSASRGDVASDGDVVPPHAAGALPDEHRDRARRLAVQQQLTRRRDHRVGDVGVRQRHAHDGRADVEHGRTAGHDLHRRRRRVDDGVAPRLRLHSRSAAQRLVLGRRRLEHGDDQNPDCDFPSSSACSSTHHFVRALVAANDFDGRQRLRRRGRRGGGARARRAPRRDDGRRPPRRGAHRAGRAGSPA